MIWTGSHFKDYPEMTRYSVSRRDPKGRQVDLRITELNPSGFMLSKQCDEATYLSGYAKILQRAEEAGVFSRLLEQAESRDIVLLCWEHDDRNCHRRLIADWLREKHGMDVRECSSIAPIRKKKAARRDSSRP
ncbi:MAG: DUF488 family protein [Spirochaetia bacterium]|jgi:uncharacterized protein YeaO (DUF488 family)